MVDLLVGKDVVEDPIGEQRDYRLYELSFLDEVDAHSKIDNLLKFSSVGFETQLLVIIEPLHKV